ncbi:MAG: ferrous iron transport protein B [Spirochaetia bacterium]|nr:ferrous iron transport protein B [Spirochaetia bacterium]
MSTVKIALAGNPNCGKTTMFNSLTGTVQYVGNWPGVTVEKKEGKVKGTNLIVTDLPGIYSLSPYTSEEIVSRDYLSGSEPDAVINIVDATNIERNLYLTTQILELGKPVVIALNMIDALKKSGDSIDTEKLAQRLGCTVIETCAVRNKGIKEIAQAAEKVAGKNVSLPVKCFSDEVENAVAKVTELISSKVNAELARWTAIKLMERDEKIKDSLSSGSDILEKIESIVCEIEKSKDDDIESIITNERYNYISRLLDGVLVKSGKKLTASDKIDRIVTNRILGIPIFLAVMGIIYYIAVTTVGTWMTDWANDSFFAGIIEKVQALLTDAGANEVLTDCIANGIIGGIGSVLGFVPQMAILFLMLSIVEDVGYMVRIAFVMDRIFRKFGLSGKSFIPLLIGSGCGVPGIMASRTIENENDRRMTIITTTWIPCGAKLPVIALFAAVLGQQLGIGSASYLAPLMYVIGIGAVVISAIMLKKTAPFHGPASPFIMELPQYHIPQLKTVLLHTWERLWGFIKKAGTILFLACLVMWFLASYGIQDGKFGLVDNSDNSILAAVGNVIRYIFIPLGFGGENGGWQAVAASISGFSAKEGIVSTLGVLANVSEELVEDDGAVCAAIIQWFPTAIASFCFLLFNLLDSPCLAAISTMANELKSRKWFWFAIGFQNIFAYVITMIVYQLGMLFVYGVFGGFTVAAIVLALFILFMVFRPNPYAKKDRALS